MFQPGMFLKLVAVGVAISILIQYRSIASFCMLILFLYFISRKKDLNSACIVSLMLIIISLLIAAGPYIFHHS
jgi:hypothetical protein